MQEKDFSELYKRAFQTKDFGDAEVSGFAERIQQTTTNLPAGFRTPTAPEISQIRDYMVAYKKQSPKASKREIRNATKKHFKLTILPDTRATS